MSRRAVGLDLVDILERIREASIRPYDQARRLIRDTARRADRYEVRRALRTYCHQHDSRGEYAGWVEEEFELAYESARSASLNGRLVSFAAAILPVSSRSRYREEFEGELAEIAAECGRIRQIRYCLRVIVRAVALRRELRKPAAERAR